MKPLLLLLFLLHVTGGEPTNGTDVTATTDAGPEDTTLLWGLSMKMWIVVGCGSAVAGIIVLGGLCYIVIYLIRLSKAREDSEENVEEDRQKKQKKPMEASSSPSTNSACYNNKSHTVVTPAPKMTPKQADQAEKERRETLCLSDRSLLRRSQESAARKVTRHPPSDSTTTTTTKESAKKQPSTGPSTQSNSN